MHDMYTCIPWHKLEYHKTYMIVWYHSSIHEEQSIWADNLDWSYSLERHICTSNGLEKVYALSNWLQRSLCREQHVHACVSLCTHEWSQCESNSDLHRHSTSQSRGETFVARCMSEHVMCNIEHVLCNIIITYMILYIWTLMRHTASTRRRMSCARARKISP